MKHASLEAQLAFLFDRQRFEENGHLAALLAETDSRYAGNALSDADLLMVSAAGDPNAGRLPDRDEDML